MTSQLYTDNLREKKQITASKNVYCLILLWHSAHKHDWNCSVVSFRWRRVFLKKSAGILRFNLIYYSGTPPYDHPVYKTTSLLRPYSFKPNVKTIESFYYFEDPVNATTSLLRPGFYGPTVVAFTGFHCNSFFSFYVAKRQHIDLISTQNSDSFFKDWRSKFLFHVT